MWEDVGCAMPGQLGERRIKDKRHSSKTSVGTAPEIQPYMSAQYRTVKSEAPTQRRLWPV